jgi:hypothetical protein
MKLETCSKFFSCHLHLVFLRDLYKATDPFFLRKMLHCFSTVHVLMMIDCLKFWHCFIFLSSFIRKFRMQVRNVVQIERDYCLATGDIQSYMLII